jgi:ribosomal protein S18 acetylase RimI-like enzyme
MIRIVEIKADAQDSASHDHYWPQIWPLLRSIIEAGDSFAWAPGTPEATIRESWMKIPRAVFVALGEADEFLGVYYIKPNGPGLAAHVANAGYATAPAARGRGVAKLMCLHSIKEAKRLGFSAMQFNFVISTNEAAVRAWQSCGFEIVGRLPKAYAHLKLGMVDALVMFRAL